MTFIEALRRVHANHTLAARPVVEGLRGHQGIGMVMDNGPSFHWGHVPQHGSFPAMLPNMETIDLDWEVIPILQIWEERRKPSEE